MTISSLIVRWNGGTERGSQRRFARAVGVGEPTVSKWISGKEPPHESIRPKVARLLEISERKLDEICPRRKRTGDVLAQIATELREIREILSRMQRR